MRGARRRRADRIAVSLELEYPIMFLSATYWIRHLGLIPHPEGGYFRELYRSGESIPHQALPGRYSGDRPFLTSIYYLLEGRFPSRIHRLHSDEIWHYHTGSPLTMHTIAPDGTLRTLRLGGDPGSGEQFQFVIPAGTWFGARVEDRESYTLVGCTVAPGFMYDDWKLGRRETLVAEYPAHRHIIEALTPET
jgi:uncharacterized protein